MLSLDHDQIYPTNRQRISWHLLWSRQGSPEIVFKISTNPAIGIFNGEFAGILLFLFIFLLIKIWYIQAVTVHPLHC